MNKYQKEKSREIRDIMRTDKWGKITYKEAKRAWKNGIRAFRFENVWVGKNLAHLGFSRKKIMEVGQAWYKVLKYCAERNLKFECYYESCVDSYILRFNGWSADGKRYGIRYAISGYELRRYRGSLMDITHRTLDEVNCRLQQFIFTPVIKPPAEIESLYPRMTVHPWNQISVEPVLGKIVEKRINDLNMGLDRKELFADSHIMSREEILAKLAVKE